MDKFSLKIIAPDGIKYEQDASALVLPTTDGEIEVLPGHMPLVSLLSPGEIIIKNGDDHSHMVTEGGLAEISETEVKILADTADSAESLDEHKIMEAKKAAEERLQNAKDHVEFAETQALLEKQLAKLRFINKRKKYR
jgi:F-type H+-transporting ATPase subunit epsilon